MLHAVDAPPATLGAGGRQAGPAADAHPADRIVCSVPDVHLPAASRRGLAFQLVAFKVLLGNTFPTIRVTTGDEVHTARFAIIANGQHYGGSYKITGPGLLTSGKLETVLLERVSLLLRPDVFWGIMARRPLNRATKSFSSGHVSAVSPGHDVPVQLDGELWGVLPMSFRVEPGALRVVR